MDIFVLRVETLPYCNHQPHVVWKWRYLRNLVKLPTWLHYETAYPNVRNCRLWMVDWLHFWLDELWTDILGRKPGKNTPKGSIQKMLYKDVLFVHRMENGEERGSAGQIFCKEISRKYTKLIWFYTRKQACVSKDDKVVVSWTVGVRWRTQWLSLTSWPAIGIGSKWVRTLLSETDR